MPTDCPIRGPFASWSEARAYLDFRSGESKSECHPNMTSATTPVSVGREPELLGQTVVVIGGSAGIGLETAGRARAAGANVIRPPEDGPDGRLFTAEDVEGHRWMFQQAAG